MKKARWYKNSPYRVRTFEFFKYKDGSLGAMNYTIYYNRFNGCCYDFHFDQ